MKSPSPSLVRGNCSPTHSHNLLARSGKGKRKRQRPKMQLWLRKVLSSLWRKVNRGVYIDQGKSEKVCKSNRVMQSLDWTVRQVQKRNFSQQFTNQGILLLILYSVFSWDKCSSYMQATVYVQTCRVRNQGLYFNKFQFFQFLQMIH